MTVETLPVHNVVVYGPTDILPDMAKHTDTGFVILDYYASGKDNLEPEERLYAAQMVASCFGVTLEEAASDFEIVVVPVGNIYDDNGRILGRRVVHKT